MRLSEYTHAASEYDRERLVAAIDRAKALGLQVIDAWSARRAVPNCYFGAWRMHAPYYRYDDDTVSLVDGHLERRPHGGTIPGHLVVDGEVPTPDGWRCLRRAGGTTEFLF